MEMKVRIWMQERFLIKKSSAIKLIQMEQMKRASKDTNMKNCNMHLPAVYEYSTLKPRPSSSSSLVNLIHIKRPEEVTIPGLFDPQNRSINGEKANGPSRISILSKRHSKDGSI